MACIHYYSISQSQFTALKSSRVHLCRKKGNVEGRREEPQADKWAGGREGLEDAREEKGEFEFLILEKGNLRHNGQHLPGVFQTGGGWDERSNLDLKGRDFCPLSSPLNSPCLAHNRCSTNISSMNEPDMIYRVRNLS